MNEYPLFPDLPEQAKIEAQMLMDEFKKNMKICCEDTLDDLYTRVADYIESDSWSNFRNELFDGLKDYPNAKITCSYDFVAIRKKILDENREEIINDLNQDLLDEIEDLKQTLKIERDYRS